MLARRLMQRSGSRRGTAPSLLSLLALQLARWSEIGGIALLTGSSRFVSRDDVLRTTRARRRDPAADVQEDPAEETVPAAA